MKPIVIVHISAALLLLACNEHLSNADVRYTWMSEDISVCQQDTLSELPRHAEGDSALGLVQFTYCEGQHTLSSWTDHYTAPPDAGTFWLELDDMGRIYQHGTTEVGFRVVRSNNDSINALIQMAMAVAYGPHGFALHYPLPPFPKVPMVGDPTGDILDTVPDQHSTK